MVKLSEIRNALKGLPVDAMNIFNGISSHAELVVNPEKIKLVTGSQIWGSGGYEGFYKIFHGNLKDHELIDVEKTSSDFIESTTYIYKVNREKPLVAYTHEYDCISSSGHRCFLCKLYIVNPNLK